MGPLSGNWEARHWHAVQQINGAVAQGQPDFAGTVESILSTVQSLVNQVRDVTRQVAAIQAAMTLARPAS